MNFLPIEQKDHGLTLFLILLCSEAFVLAPLAHTGGHTVVIINGIVFSSLLLVGVIAMSPHAKARAVSAVIVALAIALRWAADLIGSPEIYLWNSVFSLMASLTFLMLILQQVYRETPVNMHKIRGAIAAYLLMATAFSFVYNIIEQIYPGSFSHLVGRGDVQQYQQESFLYFSISTITTVGFGDITAIHPFARSMVMLESIIGILYPPVLIGILVSLHTHWLRDKEG